MASVAAKFVSKRVLNESTANKFGRYVSASSHRKVAKIDSNLAQDPYFETVPATDLDGQPKRNGKTKKIKRRINPKIPKADAEVLTKVKRRAYRLDNALSICGIRFGWSSIIGFVPA